VSLASESSSPVDDYSFSSLISSDIVFSFFALGLPLVSPSSIIVCLFFLSAGFSYKICPPSMLYSNYRSSSLSNSSKKDLYI
jgi:hypothetical protein